MGIIEAGGTLTANFGIKKTHDRLLRFELVHEDAILPSRAHPTDAGLDLHAVTRAGLAPGERRVVNTGVAVEIPAGYVGMVCPRSGLAANHGITVVNAPGIIDSGYRGEIKVVLLNTGEYPVTFQVGDRIAQLVITPVCIWTPVESSLSEADRGDNGLGSSGA